MPLDKGKVRCIILLRKEILKRISGIIGIIPSISDETDFRQNQQVVRSHDLATFGEQ